MRVPTPYIKVAGTVAVFASLALYCTSHYSLQILADLVILACLIILLVRDKEGRSRLWGVSAFHPLQTFHQRGTVGLCHEFS